MMKIKGIVVVLLLSISIISASSATAIESVNSAAKEKTRSFGSTVSNVEEATHISDSSTRAWTPSTGWTTSSTTELPITIDLNLQLFLIPPRTMRATWNKSNDTDVYQIIITMEGGRQDWKCINATEFEIHIPAGVLVIIIVLPRPTCEEGVTSKPTSVQKTVTTPANFDKPESFGNAGTSATSRATSRISRASDIPEIFSNQRFPQIDNYEGQIYVPLQLILGATTSSSLMLEWMEGEPVGEICWRERHSSGDPKDCHLATGSSDVLRDLPPSQEIEVILKTASGTSLVIYTSTRNSGKYMSYGWHCGPDSLCEDDGSTCFPATDGLLLLNPDPALVIPPTSYPYTCRCLPDDDCTSDSGDTQVDASSVIDGGGKPLDIIHADFSDFNDGKDLPFCSLPDALALIRYWCNGKQKCKIEHERLHSYFTGSEGCQSTDIANFQLTVRKAGDTQWTCPEDFEMYLPHLTCYGILSRSEVDFDTARNMCLNRGGDILYLVQEEEFLNFLNETISIPSEMWALGILKNSTGIRPPMLHSSVVDKVHAAFSDGILDNCHDDCIDVTASTVCALPPIGFKDFHWMEHKGSPPEDCPPESCQNGGTCFPVSKSPGLPGDEVNFMCHCVDGYSGLQCEHADEHSHEELLIPVDDIYHIPTSASCNIIEYAYFGRNATEDFLGCYSAEALALLRLKCEHQMNCNVSHHDLENHLGSTCHPDIPQELTVRISCLEPGSDLGCEYGGELYEVTGTCFVITDDQYEDAQSAKNACNNLGGDLAYPYEGLHVCHEGDVSAWADASQDSHSPNFNIVANETIFTCSKASVEDSMPALCEFPPVPKSLLKTTTPSTTFSTTFPTTTTTTTTLKPITDCPKIIPFPDLYPDYTWESAKPGTNTSQQCPEGSDMSGSNATWRCSELGEWINLPDMSECRNLDLGGWEVVLNDTSSGETAGDTLQRIAANITNKLSAGDILDLVRLLSFAQVRHKLDLVNVSGSEAAALNITDKYTESVTNISSMILEKPDVWHGIPRDTRFLTSSQLQDNVESAAVEVSLLLWNQTEVYNFSAISVLAQQFTSQYYTDSKNREFSHPKYGSNRVVLPSKFYDVLPDEERIAITFTAYNTLHCILSEGAICMEKTDASEYIMEGVVNSPVMGMTVGNASWEPSPGSEGVAITYAHFFTGNIYNITEGECVWWDPQNSNWSSVGCHLNRTSRFETTCICDHLTNLAVIVDVNGRLPEYILVITRWVTIVGCSISLVCLVFAIVTLVLLKLKPKHTSRITTTIHLNLCCCLFVAEIVLLAGLDATEKEGVCAFVAALLHYLLLATFCWMGVEGFNVYMLLIKVFDFGKSRMKLYYGFAYGAPLLIVSISLAATQAEGYGTKGYCWLDYMTGLTWAFAAPALLILLNNLVTFGLSLRILREHTERVERSIGRDKQIEDEASRLEERQNKRKMVKVSFSLAMTLGITWLLGFTVMFKGMEWMAVIFTIINSLQGLGLFVVLILFPARPRSQFLKLIPCGPKMPGTGWFRTWYPYGKHDELSEFSSSGESTSHYYQGRSSLRWAKTLSTMSEVSSGTGRNIRRPTTFESEDTGIIKIPRVIINPRKGSGELDISVKRDLEALSDASQSRC